MKLLWREPLVYFLLLSGVIFALSLLTEEPVDDQQQIVVDRVSLLRFIQQKTKTMDRAVLLRSFDEMSPAKRQQWISAYIRQQALYREAQALGLDDNDPVIESRLIQKLEFITQQYSEQALKISAAQLQDYYNDERGRSMRAIFTRNRKLHLDGRIHPDFGAVEATLRNQLGNYPGGAGVCVYHRGECVVDLWGGYKDEAGTLWVHAEKQG